MAAENGHLGFVEKPEVYEVEPLEDDDFPKHPVQMRDKSGESKKGPRVSLVSRVPATPRTSYAYQQPPSFWSQFNLHTYMQERIVHPMAWVVFAFLVLGLVIIVITFCAPGWALTLEIRAIDGWFEGEMHGYYGLWYACWRLLEGNDYTRQSCELMADLENVPTWYNGVQAMGALSLFGAAASMMAVSIYICAKTKNEKPRVILASVFFSTATGLCCAIQIVVFCVLFIHDARWCCSGQAQVVQWRLQYCFILACGAVIVFWGAAVAAYFEYRRVRRPARTEKYLQRVHSTRRDARPGYY